ncbi:Flp pilus assembly protein CpaB [Methylotenera mobilis]|uniref:Flp pilus assembly protein CpaB n=1 Tax=Methylotenera mobilis (strain JLW8 / ATCC BAA-1282 / DSM 17540) TaxID=583345 RepID=C6WWK8_METML|nr:Flp pilus assembly protein CpaB [Methylotenera mobilis]ACT48307.1 Flp pilus assembly protein CpaB [Methylotenera mobilis JLW8]
MKNPRAFLMIVVSVGIGLGAVVLASRWISQQAATVASSKVVVAAINIDLGTPLTPQMLKVADWPRGSVPVGATDDIKTLDARVVKTSLLQGEPVLESKLAPLGATGGLSAVIAEGNRAMTVRVNDVVGVAGFALPGNYVDIVVNTEDESVKAENVNKSISKIVLEHIMVLAVAQEQNRDETKPKVVNAVTLEVTPAQAEKLDLARSVGTLSLVLRNQIDKNVVTTEGSTKKNLLNRVDEPPAPVMAAAAQQPVAKTEVKHVVKKSAARKPVVQRESYEQVEVVRGATKTVEEFKPSVQ